MTNMLQNFRILRFLKAYSESALSELNVFRHFSISCQCQSTKDDFFGIEEYVEHKTRNKKLNYTDSRQDEMQGQHYNFNPGNQRDAYPTNTNISSDRDSKRASERRHSSGRRHFSERRKSVTSRSEESFRKSKELDRRLKDNYDNFENQSIKYGSDFIDDQYFDVQNRTTNRESKSVGSLELDENSRFDSSESRQDFDIIDKHYFGNSDQKKHPHESSQSEVENSHHKENLRHEKYDRKDMDYIDDQYFGMQSKEQLDEQSKPKNETFTKPKSNSAYDAAMEIRMNLKHGIKNLDTKGKKSHEGNEGVKTRFEGLVDSKGFRILKYQTQDLTKEPEGIVVDILKKNVIYNEGDIIAINKPYGLPSHGGPGVKFSVGGLLQLLAQSLDLNNSLHLVHRLDKETTGVMLLAKDAKTAADLREHFIKRQVVKKYWVITKGIPDPLEGVIKIPITEGSLNNGIHRMILKPEYSKKYDEVMKKRNIEEAQDAITKYNVFKQHNSAALIECQPISGVKHQIRCHLGFGLNTPVLGDHKYSHFNKLAPQRLPPDMLTSLGIRQSKVRHLPMHLHAKSILIPEYKDGQNLMVSAKLPKHFLVNLRRLKLN